MAYTVNTPLQNQKIAATQAPIQQNFAFINSSIQQNHTFNGNPISGEADGSHQKLQFPNQGSDLAVLPTGIAAIQYAKGGNLYNFNAATGKGPVSGVSFGGTQALSTTPVAILTVPANSIGVLNISIPVVGGTNQAINFFTDNTTLYVNSGAFGPFSASITASFVLNIRVNTGTPTANFKYIYWPI